MFFALSSSLVAPETVSAQDTSPKTQPVEAKESEETQEIRVHFTDGSHLIVGVLDKEIKLHTRFGDLTVPMKEVTHIDFATRLTLEDIQEIETEIRNLASDDSKTRESAKRRLMQLKSRAWLRIKQAAEGQIQDTRVAAAARVLADEMAADEDAQLHQPRELDVVRTRNSIVSGRIVAGRFRVITRQFGPQVIPLSGLSSIKNLWSPDVATGKVIPDPGGMQALQGKVGKTFRIRVKASRGRTVWGTDSYTLDSSLATAAIHAGVLRHGETGIVQVTILGPKQGFKASNRNGITSHAWGHFPGAYRIQKPGILPPVPEK